MHLVMWQWHAPCHVTLACTLSCDSGMHLVMWQWHAPCHVTVACTLSCDTVACTCSCDILRYPLSQLGIFVIWFVETKNILLKLIVAGEKCRKEQSPEFPVGRQLAVRNWRGISPRKTPSLFDRGSTCKLRRDIPSENTLFIWPMCKLRDFPLD